MFLCVLCATLRKLQVLMLWLVSSRNSNTSWKLLCLKLAAHDFAPLYLLYGSLLIGKHHAASDLPTLRRVSIWIFEGNLMKCVFVGTKLRKTEVVACTVHIPYFASPLNHLPLVTVDGANRNVTYDTVRRLTIRAQQQKVFSRVVTWLVTRTAVTARSMHQPHNVRDSIAFHCLTSFSFFSAQNLLV